MCIRFRRLFILHRNIFHILFTFWLAVTDSHCQEYGSWVHNFKLTHFTVKSAKQLYFLLGFPKFFRGFKSPKRTWIAVSEWIGYGTAGRPHQDQGHCICSLYINMCGIQICRQRVIRRWYETMLNFIPFCVAYLLVPSIIWLHNVQQSSCNDD